MNTPSRWKLAMGLAMALWLAGCSDRSADTPPPAPAPAPAAPTLPPTPVTDQWVGEWGGPEGSLVRITGGNGHYEVTIQNVDGPRTFVGRAVGEKIEFERDGNRETLQASDGAGTGMKWLAGKQDCLKVKAGEGYCRD